jgi:hypothetical protein
MKVTDLEAAGRVLAGERGFCELCGESIQIWPGDHAREHALAKHRETMWPKYVELYEQFLLEPQTAEKAARIRNMHAEYLVKILATRFDLYRKLVAAGVIVSPRKG